MPNDIDHFREVLRRELPALAERFHVSSLALFGSYVRHENRPDSDLDVLVEFSKAPSLFRYIELEVHLSKLLEVKVDLVMRKALKARIGLRVMKELVEL